MSAVKSESDPFQKYNEEIEGCLKQVEGLRNSSSKAEKLQLVEKVSQLAQNITKAMTTLCEQNSQESSKLQRSTESLLAKVSALMKLSQQELVRGIKPPNDSIEIIFKAVSANFYNVARLQSVQQEYPFFWKNELQQKLLLKMVTAQRTLCFINAVVNLKSYVNENCDVRDPEVKDIALYLLKGGFSCDVEVLVQKIIAVKPSWWTFDVQREFFIESVKIESLAIPQLLLQANFFEQCLMEDRAVWEAIGVLLKYAVRFQNPERVEVVENILIIFFEKSLDSDMPSWWHNEVLPTIVQSIERLRQGDYFSKDFEERLRMGEILDSCSVNDPKWEAVLTSLLRGYNENGVSLLENLKNRAPQWFTEDVQLGLLDSIRDIADNVVYWQNQRETKGAPLLQNVMNKLDVENLIAHCSLSSPALQKAVTALCVNRLLAEEAIVIFERIAQAQEKPVWWSAQNRATLIEVARVGSNNAVVTWLRIYDLLGNTIEANANETKELLMNMIGLTDIRALTFIDAIQKAQPSWWNTAMQFEILAKVFATPHESDLHTQRELLLQQLNCEQELRDGALSTDKAQEMFKGLIIYCKQIEKRESARMNGDEMLTLESKHQDMILRFFNRLRVAKPDWWNGDAKFALLQFVQDEHHPMKPIADLLNHDLDVLERTDSVDTICAEIKRCSERGTVLQRSKATRAQQQQYGEKVAEIRIRSERLAKKLSLQEMTNTQTAAQRGQLDAVTFMVNDLTAALENLQINY